MFRLLAIVLLLLFQCHLHNVAAQTVVTGTYDGTKFSFTLPAKPSFVSAPSFTANLPNSLRPGHSSRHNHNHNPPSHTHAPQQHHSHPGNNPAKPPPSSNSFIPFPVSTQPRGTQKQTHPPHVKSHSHAAPSSSSAQPTNSGPPHQQQSHHTAGHGSGANPTRQSHKGAQSSPSKSASGSSGSSGAAGAASAQSTNSPKKTSSSGSSSADSAKRIGLSVGLSILGVLIIGIILWLVFFKKTKRQPPPDSEGSSFDNGTDAAFLASEKGPAENGSTLDTDRPLPPPTLPVVSQGPELGSEPSIAQRAGTSNAGGLPPPGTATTTTSNGPWVPPQPSQSTGTNTSGPAATGGERFYSASNQRSGRPRQFSIPRRPVPSE